MSVVFSQRARFVTIHHGLEIMAGALVLIRNRSAARKTSSNIQTKNHVRIVLIVTLDQLNARQAGTILRTTCSSLFQHNDKTILIFRIRVGRSALVVLIVIGVPSIVSTSASQTVSVFEIVDVSCLCRSQSGSCAQSK